MEKKQKLYDVHIFKNNNSFFVRAQFREHPEIKHYEAGPFKKMMDAMNFILETFDPEYPVAYDGELDEEEDED